MHYNNYSLDVRVVLSRKDSRVLFVVTEESISKMLVLFRSPMSFTYPTIDLVEEELVSKFKSCLSLQQIEIVKKYLNLKAYVD